jgi:hypothetical protein
VKIAARVAGVLLGLLVLLGIAQQIAAESGEVVVLTTTDAEGRSHETRLWVVDHEGSAWLRAGADVQAWYRRLLERPEVEVERGGSRRPFTAVPQPDQQGTVDRLMRAKYGWADRFISLLFGRDDSVPIRLDPR